MLGGIDLVNLVWGILSWFRVIYSGGWVEDGVFGFVYAVVLFMILRLGRGGKGV